jgi:2-amino-4-hydroxy-6-hydroxymethyldihydropteridine diphosphokinase
MEPQSLINLLKDAEDHQGRTPTFRNGPRVVDLDVLFDDNKIYNLNEVEDRSLVVPHPSLQAREFVLLPLAE